MSSAESFEVLRAVSQQLTDDFIDEDISEMQSSSRDQRTITNRTITVRGKRDGQALVLCYQDYYSTSFSATSIPVYERRILEIFAAQPAVSCEARCRVRTILDKLAGWFGGGGAKGPHPVFARLRIDVEEGDPSSFERPGFPEALERLASRGNVERVLLNVGSGITAIVSWYGPHTTPEATLELVDQVRAVTATLGAAAT